MIRASSAALAVLLGCLVTAAEIPVPRIWDDAALAEWATPVAGLNVRPAHYSSAEYYASPEENLRTYPVYHPDSEPSGYWEWLQRQKPEPLVDIHTIRQDADWIDAGARAFRDIDAVLLRTNDPAVIAQARDPRNFEGLFKLPDGSAFGARWVVTTQGVMLTVPACANCHVSTAADGSLVFGGPGGARRASPAPFGIRGLPFAGPAGTMRRLQLFYVGDPAPTAFWREFTTPWAPDDRVERTRTMTLGSFVGREDLGRAFSGGMFARQNGSPYHPTKIMDLQNLRDSRYLDATATHRLRGPGDVARYTALVTGADRLDFGPHRILTDQQRKVRFHYADAVLYAIGSYLLSLEPPHNPTPAPREVLNRGEQIFRRETCANCHVPPTYTSGKLTLAGEWTPPLNHVNRDDILPVSVGTDSGAALRTRKGTGFYKIPSLRGVWYRPLLLHDGSFKTLEEMFDPARLESAATASDSTTRTRGRRASGGHPFGLSLTTDERQVLLAFLRSL